MGIFIALFGKMFDFNMGKMKKLWWDRGKTIVKSQNRMIDNLAKCTMAKWTATLTP